MIDIEQATSIVLDHKLDLGTEEVLLQQAAGRVLAETISADRDFPPFDRVTMDGISIAYAAFAEKGIRTFSIQDTQAAGTPQKVLGHPDHCMEVMTGAVLPEGTDTVIRYEDLEIKNGSATVNVDTLQEGQNVHRRGEDRQKGEVIIEPGILLSAGEIGVAATVGKSRLTVRRIPRAVIISTGDELVDVDQTPEPHQIRSSNAYTIRTMLAKWGIAADLLHLIDEPQHIKKELERCLREYDIILISGGVSKGKFDYVPDALAALGVEKLFHRVRQRPGKPFWFGHWKEKCIIFALPGNPVSSFMCTNRYVGPWIRASLGLDPLDYDYAVLDADFHFRPDLTYFLQVKVEYARNGVLRAIPVEGHGSGDLANLVDADGFLELPRGRDQFHAGELFPLIIYR